jgi:hypothetical protein
MPIMRVVQGGEPDEDGILRGEAHLQRLDESPYHVNERERNDALLAETERAREVEWYSALNVKPTNNLPKPQGVFMAEEKSEEQRERESVNSVSGEREQLIRQQEEEKLKVENAVTSHAGITKMADGQSVRLVNTAENYALEPGERGEGLPLDGEPNPLSIAQADGRSAGWNTMDDAERALQPQQHGDAHSAQHATGDSDPATGVRAKATGELKEGGGDVLEEKDFNTEKGTKAAEKAHAEDAKQSGGEPSKAQQKGSSTSKK